MDGRKASLVGSLGLLLGTLAGCAGDLSAPQPSDQPIPSFSFDNLGYNRGARIFQGPADGVDGTLDGTVWGDPTYANDLLKMKWNAEWDRGNDEGWSDLNGYDAWLDNNWNGQVPGGSGEVWQYRIKWISACGADGTPTGDGGYCIWSQFEIILSHGTVLNQHFWDAHAVPAGFGN